MKVELKLVVWFSATSSSIINYVGQQLMKLVQDWII